MSLTARARPGPGSPGQVRGLPARGGRPADAEEADERAGRRDRGRLGADRSADGPGRPEPRAWTGAAACRWPRGRPSRPGGGGGRGWPEPRSAWYLLGGAFTVFLAGLGTAAFMAGGSPQVQDPEPRVIPSVDVFMVQHEMAGTDGAAGQPEPERDPEVLVPRSVTSARAASRRLTSVAVVIGLLGACAVLVVLVESPGQSSAIRGVGHPGRPRRAAPAAMAPLGTAGLAPHSATPASRTGLRLLSQAAVACETVPFHGVQMIHLVRVRGRDRVGHPGLAPVRTARSWSRPRPPGPARRSRARPARACPAGQTRCCRSPRRC